MEDIDIIFIDPPMQKMEDDTFLYGNLYQPEESARSRVFNPGVLSIASYLSYKSYNVKIKHILKENEIALSIKELFEKYNPRVVAISCCYMHTYLPTIEIVKNIRQYYDGIVLEGGQHVADIASFALAEMECDVVVRGEGEYAIEKILKMLDGKKEINQIGNLCFTNNILKRFGGNENDFALLETKDFVNEFEMRKLTSRDIYVSKFFEPLMKMDEMPFLKYDLYEDYLKYPPYLEESRGCYGKCKFCVSSECNTYRFKTAERFLDELEYVISIYGKDNVIPFTAANFGVNVENTIKICEGIINKYGKLKWIAEFRLDLNWERYVELMYKSGCVSFNIGLESASPEILKIMKKTTDPIKYLNKANKLMDTIISFPNANIHLNFMFYIGENAKSMADNMRFISKYYKNIAAVHYSPVILYCGTDAWNEFDVYHELYGSTIVKKQIYDRMHAYPVNVSYMYSYYEGCVFSRMIEKMFLETEGYMLNHETRLSRDSDGNVDEDAKKAYIRRMMETSKK